MHGNHYTQEQYILEARQIHGNRYDYSLLIYENSRTKVKIICHQHGIFEQQAASHLFGCGCPNCGILKITEKNRSKYKANDFIKKAQDFHGDRYNYDKVIYVNAKIPVEIICSVHGSFFQTPDTHLRKCKKGGGCQKCMNTARIVYKTKTLDDFILDSRKVHGLKYDYSQAKYINTHKKVKIICKRHGIFEMRPHDHIDAAAGCPACKKKHSKDAIRWFKSIMNQENIKIQHAENGGEYRIPTTRLLVDGFCHESNTVYEFYGSRYHGDPRRFKPEEFCHPYQKNKTAKELYENTIQRERTIMSLGYHLITKWEPLHD